MQRVQAVPVPAQARDGSRRRLARLVTPWSLRVRCGNSYSANILIPRSNQHDSNRLLTPSKVARWAGHAQCPLMALSSTCAVPEASQARPLVDVVLQPDFVRRRALDQLAQDGRAAAIEWFREKDKAEHAMGPKWRSGISQNPQRLGPMSIGECRPKSIAAVPMCSR